MKKLVLIFLVLLAFPVSGDDIPLELRGYYKSFLYFYDYKDGTDNELESDKNLLNQNVFRLKLFSDPAEWLSMEVAYSLSPTVSMHPSDGMSMITPSVDSYRVVDVDETILTQGNFKLNNNIDRLTFSFALPFADIIIGRQAISFGSARFFNPTDVFSPFSFQELNKEEKFGIDAIRVKFPLGEMGEIDLGYVFGHHADWKKSAAFARVRFPIGNYDISIIAMEYKTHLMAGLNVSGSIGGAGVWFEGAYTFAGLLEDGSDMDFDKSFVRLSAGFDYYFPHDIYFFFEYHYSQAGTLDSDEYLINYLNQTAAYQDSGVYLMGEHYLAPGLTWQVHPLVSFAFTVLFNCADPSGMISASLDWSIVEDVSISAGANISLGKRSNFYKIPFPQVNSEFGFYPDIYYVNLKMYF